jgi:hypothetical protein
MLNIIQKKQAMDEDIRKELLDKVSDCEGFIVLSIKNEQVQWNRYQLDNPMTLYLLEWARLRLMNDTGV